MPAARSARRWPPITCIHGQPRTLDGRCDGMHGAYLGPAYAQDEIERRLDGGRRAASRRLDERRADRRDARRRWPTGKAVGWFQGRMEFGPRALGARSILGDPRSPDDAEDAQPQGQVPRDRSARSRPSVLREDVADWFELDGDSPYMLLVADVVRSAPPRR